MNISMQIYVRRFTHISFLHFYGIEVFKNTQKHIREMSSGLSDTWSSGRSYISNNELCATLHGNMIL